MGEASLYADDSTVGRRAHMLLDRPTPLVSVITIFLNARAFLNQAVESVFAQTWKEWELLLVDDGSTDGSTEIAQAYADHQPDKVHYLTHPGHENRGMSASRNLGLEHAGGRLIAFLDADDIWLPQKLERQLALLDAHPEVDMVYGPSRLWYGWTGRPEDAHRDDWRRLGLRPDTAIDPPRLLIEYLKDRIQTPATCSVLLRREAVERVGGFENRFRGMYEDQAFFVKIFRTARVLPAAQSWDLYRQHPGSTSAQAALQGEYHPEMPNPGLLSFLKWLRDYLVHAEGQDSELIRLVDRRLWFFRYPRIHRLVQHMRLLPDRMKGFLLADGAALAFRFGRRLLPHPVRQWVWSRWINH